MFHIFDLSLLYLDQHGPAQADDKDTSPLLAYAAWCALRGIPAEEWNQHKDAYLQQQQPGEGDGLDRALKTADPLQRRALVEFYYQQVDLAGLQPPAVPSAMAEADRKAALEKLSQPQTLNRLLGVELQPNTPMDIHLSAVAGERMYMFYFMEEGMFLCIGEQVPLNEPDTSWSEDLQVLCRALGDPSRFAIVQALLKEPLSVAQIAQQVDLSLSTVIHHLKQLTEARAVSLQLGSKGGRGSLYQLNRSALLGLMDAARHAMQ